MKDVSIQHLQDIEEGDEPKRMVLIELANGELETITFYHDTLRDIAEFIRESYPNARRFEEI
jgi:hypothetical protein